ncbi:ATP-binding cassette, subfamily B, MsbA [Caldanaerobius fijiensis DSM 17918]|uniref:ATP-binding cassette, subfamily B, MsbA n=1 Tax=Caldanaerobius fijiensis DSM 17918 TaxID=1121256 RepID=A0A1M4Y220_9THEO|nr:ABC transporter ATP-binding protein [Caldanaerobius fijiensis]SHE99729.1 ATP-binding cassette, subfamily B, MsbA [Caldanaerobius fijiensis DSM 17918]
MKFNKKSIIFEVLAVLIGLIGMMSSWLLYPWAFKILIDSFENNKIDISLYKVIILLFIGRVLGEIFINLSSYLYTQVKQNIIVDFRNRIYSHVCSVPIHKLKRMQIGDIMSCLTNDIPVYAEKYEAVGEMIVDIILFFTTIVIIKVINVKLLWLVPAFCIVFTLLPYYLSKRLREISTKLQDKISNYNSTLQESLVAAREIKALNACDLVNDRLKNIIEDIKHKSLKEKFVSLESSSGPYLFFYVLEALAFLISVFEIQRGRLEPGTAVASIMYIGNIIVPLQNFGNLFASIRTSDGAWDRIKNLNIIEEEKEEKKLKVLKNIKGNIFFKNVSFQYPGSEFRLEGIDLEIKAKSKTALVGLSGAGKSTIADLLLKFYKPNRGHIYIDGIDISEIKDNSLRDHIGVVFQEPFLFKASIKENIRFGKWDATDEEVIEAAKRANAHDFIIKMPDGYETELGEMGTGLSGGQKQRIAIARVLLRNPEILIFDEATSWLDKEASRRFVEEIDKLAMDKTVIIITHDLGMVTNADQIVVLERGKIVEKGIHHELMEQKGLYYKLFINQEREDGES